MEKTPQSTRCELLEKVDMKRYSKAKKSKNIKKHFNHRCKERLGFKLNSQELVRMIQKNELDFVRRTSNTRTVFRYHCQVNNRDYNVVYDKLRHDVVTIYKANGLRSQKRKDENDINGNSCRNSNSMQHSTA